MKKILAVLLCISTLGCGKAPNPAPNAGKELPKVQASNNKNPKSLECIEKDINNMQIEVSKTMETSKSVLGKTLDYGRAHWIPIAVATVSLVLLCVGYKYDVHNVMFGWIKNKFKGGTAAPTNPPPEDPNKKTENTPPADETPHVDTPPVEPPHGDPPPMVHGLDLGDPPPPKVPKYAELTDNSAQVSDSDYYSYSSEEEIEKEKLEDDTDDKLPEIELKTKKPHRLSKQHIHIKKKEYIAQHALTCKKKPLVEMTEVS